MNRHFLYNEGQHLDVVAKDTDPMRSTKQVDVNRSDAPSEQDPCKFREDLAPALNSLRKLILS